MRRSINQYIPSGSFETGRTQNCRLTAFLGTCVGVALFDATSGVGGLIHLLLPEPVSAGGADQPEKYAATGMPLFIDRLLAMGAVSENMQAVIAGGALVGPLTRQDINLDIGGRTADIACAALDNAGIKVVRSETGGFFTCCIELDMQTWQCDIRPAGLDVPATAPASKPDRGRVTTAIDAIKPIPQVALKVLRIIETDEYDIEQLTDTVKKDQVISARTIQLCNSAIFTKHQDVTSLDHALVYLGREPFLKLVISAAVQSYFNQTGNGYSLCKGGLYHHAIGTAMVAEAIAAHTGAAAPAVAYTAGLLHDIGKVVLDQFVADAYPMLYRQMRDENAEFLEVESRTLGMDHTHAGGLLASRWSLPASIAEVIRHHHRPEKCPGRPVLVTIVHLADLLMSRFHTGLELERIGAGRLAEHLAQLTLTTGHVQQLIDRIPVQVFQPAAAAF